MASPGVKEQLLYGWAGIRRGNGQSTSDALRIPNGVCVQRTQTRRRKEFIVQRTLCIGCLRFYGAVRQKLSSDKLEPCNKQAYFGHRTRRWSVLSVRFAGHRFRAKSLTKLRYTRAIGSIKRAYSPAAHERTEAYLVKIHYISS